MLHTNFASIELRKKWKTLRSTKKQLFLTVKMLSICLVKERLLYLDALKKSRFSRSWVSPWKNWNIFRRALNIVSRAMLYTKEMCAQTVQQRACEPSQNGMKAVYSFLSLLMCTTSVVVLFLWRFESTFRTFFPLACLELRYCDSHCLKQSPNGFLPEFPWNTTSIKLEVSKWEAGKKSGHPPFIV